MLTSFPVKPGVRDCFQRANVHYPPGPCQRSLYNANEADHCQIYLCISQYEPVFKRVSIATFLCWLTNSGVLCYLRQVFQSMLKPCAMQATAQREEAWKRVRIVLKCLFLIYSYWQQRVVPVPNCRVSIFGSICHHHCLQTWWTSGGYWGRGLKALLHRGLNRGLNRGNVHFCLIWFN